MPLTRLVAKAPLGQGASQLGEIFLPANTRISIDFAVQISPEKKVADPQNENRRSWHPWFPPDYTCTCPPVVSGSIRGSRSYTKKGCMLQGKRSLCVLDEALEADI
jgi:hypothetical protein